MKIFKVMYIDIVYDTIGTGVTIRAHNMNEALRIAQERCRKRVAYDVYSIQMVNL